MTEYESQTNERILESGETDKGLAEIKYVLHGNSSAQDAEQIEKNGLKVSEGRPTVSTDLAHALDWAVSAEKRDFSLSPTDRGETEAGTVFVFSIPDKVKVGYGMFTAAKVDEVAKSIKGAPIKWASGRKQLALYSSEDTDVTRKRIEAEHGVGKESQQLEMLPENIALTIHPSPELSQIVNELQKKVRRFEQPDVDQVIQQLVEQIRADTRNKVEDGVSLESLVPELVKRTIESVATSRARNLDLDVKRLMGYRVEAEAGPKDREVNIQKIKEAVNDFHQATHTDGFTLGEEWLNGYLSQESEKLASEMASI